ncbi:ADP-ribosylation factor-like protein 2 isoform X2 [Talpa occidentalis]|uniref:ADP-ribosylation factor-like protein 2 isoform X2 n=1 Tax=Talpa occidentalis TaxID=50954 RepID=UPI0023F9A3EB|nr:ADP-ribosylation factor-like protein 2 isoform X2 [Talpa occidentalis]
MREGRWGRVRCRSQLVHVRGAQDLGAVRRGSGWHMNRWSHPHKQDLVPESGQLQNPGSPICLLTHAAAKGLEYSRNSGLDNAGKTTILKKFNGEDIDTISPTLGFNIKTLEHRGFKLNIWDVGGQKSLRSYWRNYFESTDGLIWVVDSADRQRMQDCQRELQSLLVEERLAGATLLIFANKQDLPGALSSNAIREALELDSIRSHHWCIQGCSAFTGENLLLGIDWLLDDISSRIFTTD